MMPPPLCFNERVDDILAHKAITKGYDGRKGQLFSFCRTLPHPLGEIVYKVARYHQQGDPDDLVKIAGWARLIWEQHYADREGSVGGDTAGPGFTRASDQGLVASVANSRAGDAGGDSRGTRSGARASSIYPAFDPNIHVTGRTGASGRRRRTVGKQHRQRKGKGKT